MKYEGDPRFAPYYFEDSWVLSFAVSGERAAFVMDAVLAPDHPRFGPPKAGERYRYERIELSFSEIERLRFEASRIKANIDPDGTKDFGNIDVFTIEPPHRYTLSGEWGELDIIAGTAAIAEIPTVEN